MTLYAHNPGRMLLQLTADVLFVGWVVLWAWMGVTVHDATLALAAPGRLTDQSASAMADRLRDAGGRLDDVPVVGDEVAIPFDEAAEASDGLAAAGRSSVEAVEDLALWLGLSIALIPILAVGAVHLPLRWRFVREATAGARFVDTSEDLDLFALRALAHRPMHLLARISDDPAGAWRRQDPAVVRRLAELELREVGLRPPRRTAGDPTA